MGGRCCYGEGDFGGAGSLVVGVDDGYAEADGAGWEIEFLVKLEAGF